MTAEPFVYCTTQPELFAAAARFISSEETRYYLRGVKIEPQQSGGVKLIATDGHRMFVGFDATGTASREAIITPPKIKMPSSWFKSKGAVFAHGLAYRFQHFGADAETAAKPAAELSALASDVSVATEIIDATYPDWSRIAKWPGSVAAPSDAWTMNWQYIAEAQEVKGLLTGARTAVMPFRQSGEGDVVAIRLTDEAAVWITPMRNHDGDAAFKRPHWL